MNKLYKLFILSFAIIANVAVCKAQVSATYNFTQTSGSFSGLVGATILGNSTNDENIFGPFNIGFNFNFNGTIYTQFSVNTNGFIVLGGATAGTSSYVLSDVAGGGGTINNAIAGCGMDLIGQNNSVLWYQLQGSSVNQILVVEWKNYNEYNSISSAPGVGNALNFQIQLYKTSNKIQVVYGTMAGDSMPYMHPEVGLRGASNADFNNRKVNMSNMWSTSGSGTMNSDVCLLSNVIHPMTGQTYIWTRTSVGVDNIAPEVASFFDFYPNPSTETVKISIPTFHIDNCTITIYDMQGKSVYTSKDTNIVGNYSKVISTQNMAKGIYYIRLDTSVGAEVKKLVVQ